MRRAPRPVSVDRVRISGRNRPLRRKSARERFGNRSARFETVGRPVAGSPGYRRRKSSERSARARFTRSRDPKFTDRYPTAGTASYSTSKRPINRHSKQAVPKRRMTSFLVVFYFVRLSHIGKIQSILNIKSTEYKQFPRTKEKIVL